MKEIKLVRGVGIKDVDYVVQKTRPVAPVNGKRKQVLVWICPYYEKWRNMVIRCYCKKYQTKNPTYEGTTIDPDWLYLSNFIKWVDSQPNKDWQNCSLDKDILVQGNKHYSPETCVFIPESLNNFVLASSATRGKYLLGVYWHKEKKKFKAQCSDPFKVNSVHVGYFNTELEAHKAWQAKKHEYACQLAELQDDPRISRILMSKYASDNDLTNN